MAHNLKTLGLALAAVFAIGAVATSAAMAQQGTLTSDGPVTEIATETGGAGTNFLKAFGLNLACPGSTYTGHQYNVTPHTLIPSGATTGTLTPQFKQTNHNCLMTPGNFPLTIDMNGCDYVVHFGATTGGVAGTYGVTFDMVCPAGQEGTVTVWTNTTDETNAAAPFCVLHIPPQSGIAGLHATDTGVGDIDLSGTLTGIKVLKTKSTHAILCPAAETKTAESGLDLTVQGRNGGGSATAISISHP